MAMYNCFANSYGIGQGVQRPASRVPVAAAVDAVCGQRFGRAEPSVRRPPRWRSDAPSWYLPESQSCSTKPTVCSVRRIPWTVPFGSPISSASSTTPSRRERPDRSRRIVAARWIDWISLLIARAPQTGGRTVRRVGRSAVRCGRVRRAVGGRGPRHGDGRRWRAGSRPGSTRWLPGPRRQGRAGSPVPPPRLGRLVRSAAVQRVDLSFRLGAARSRGSPAAGRVHRG